MMKLKYYFLIFVFPVIGSLSVAIFAMESHAKSGDEKSFAEAFKVTAQGDYTKALAMYRNICQQNANADNQARALFFIGNIYDACLRRPEDAATVYQLILNRHPESAMASDALFHLGVSYFHMENFVYAYRKFSEYVNIYPEGIRRKSAGVWSENALNRIGKCPLPGLKTDKPGLSDTVMRVLLKKGVRTVTFTAVDNLNVTGDYFNRFSQDFHSIGVTVSLRNQKLYLNDNEVVNKKLLITSSSPVICLEHHAYRGGFVILYDDTGLIIINNIPVEEYLYGVIPLEMPENWDKEALMAQSVAARTYALYMKEKHCDRKFDIETTTRSQLYGGYASETPNTTAAVNATKGEVISFYGELIASYFHSNSGGHTEDSVNVWGINLPYLKGVPDIYSKNGPHSSWQCFFRKKDIDHILNQRGIDMGRVEKLNCESVSESGRANMVSLVTDTGNIRVTGNNFRIAMGADVMKSTLFEMVPKEGGWLFRGKGFGHGVGLSQWGAYQMAQAGYSYKDIISHYYSDVKIVTIATN